MVTGKTAILRAQRRWADARGLRYDALGCVRTLDDNLLAPLDEVTLAELARGSELLPTRLGPARFHWLCSSAALVVNVFAYWRGRDPTPLAEALGVTVPPGSRLTFEEPLSTGLPGDPPSADVALHGLDARGVFIESKFTEWLVRRPRNKRVFKDKYFPQDEGVWSAAGLPRCQILADALQDGEVRFKHLNAAQLLKHALGLVATGRRTSALVYLYYEHAGRQAMTHREELDRIREALAPELEFRFTTYQAVFAALRASAGVEPDYVEYLSRRYFA